MTKKPRTYAPACLVASSHPSTNHPEPGCPKARLLEFKDLLTDVGLIRSSSPHICHPMSSPHRICSSRTNIRMCWCFPDPYILSGKGSNLPVEVFPRPEWVVLYMELEDDEDCTHLDEFVDLSLGEQLVRLWKRRPWPPLTQSVGLLFF